MDKADVDDKVKEHQRVKTMHKEKKIAKKDRKDRVLYCNYIFYLH